MEEKFQIEFAQCVANPHVRPGSINALLNASDDRFSEQKNGLRYAWISGTPADIKASLDIDVSDIALGELGQTKELGILNPSIGGKRLNIQVTETTKGDEFDMANLESRAKRAGKDGEFIMTASSEHIFV